MTEKDHLEVIPTHKEKFIQIEKAIGLLQSFDQKMIEVTSNQNASLERIHERLDDWNEQTKAIILLAHSVEDVVKETKKTQETVGEAMKLIQDLNMRTHDIEMKKYEEQFKEQELEMEGIKTQLIVLENKAGKVALQYIEKVFTYLLLAGVAGILIAVGYYINRPQ